MATMINCPYCGKLTDPGLDNCPHCGGASPRRGPAQPALRRPAVRGRQTCPNCQAVIQDGDIICFVCGTNLLTGQKVTEEAAPPGSNRLGMVAAMIAAAVLVTVGGLWVYTLQGDALERAKRLIRDGEYLEAQDVLTNYIAREPEDDRALFELGKLQWRNSQYMDAAESFSRSAQLNPARDEALVWRVASLGAAGITPANRNAQIVALERLVDGDPDNPHYLFLYGLSLTDADQTQTQLEALQRAADVEPADEAIRWCLGLMHALTGDGDAAARELQLAGKRSGSGDAKAIQGLLASAAGDRAAAFEHLSRALKTDGLSIRWQVQTELGKLKMAEGRFQEAEDHLEEAVRLRPDNSTGLYLSALCAQSLGRPRDVLSLTRRIPERRGPIAVSAGVLEAQAYLFMDDIANAEEAIKRTANAGELTAAYYTMQGRVFAARSQNPQARDAFARAMALDPNYAPAFLEGGLLHVKNDELKAGLEKLERYVALLGRDVSGTNARDVRALITQLRQTVGEASSVDAESSAVAGRVGA